MRKRVAGVWEAAGAAALAAFLGLGSARLGGLGVRSAEARETSAELTKRVEGELEHDSQLRERGIRVQASEGGVVKLTGTVRSDAERARAQRIARVPGVKWVDNDLSVDAASPGAPKRTVDVGAEVNKAGDKVGHELDETWLTTKVKAQLMTDEALAGTDIRVTTNNDIVALEGIVPSEAARARALEIARTTKGVLSVEDRLVVMRTKP